MPKPSRRQPRQSPPRPAAGADVAEFRVLIGTHVFDASEEFYGAVLGFPVTLQWESDEHQGRGRIFAATAEARIEIIEGAVTPKGLTVGIQTDDVAAVAARLGDRLVQPLTDQPWGHRNCGAVDPNGVTLTFFQVMHAE